MWERIVQNILPKKLKKGISLSFLLGLFLAGLLHWNLALLGGMATDSSSGQNKGKEEPPDKGEVMRKEAKDRADEKDPTPPTDSTKEKDTTVKDTGSAPSTSRRARGDELELDQRIMAEGEARSGGRAPKEESSFGLFVLGLVLLLPVGLFVSSFRSSKDRSGKRDNAYKDPAYLRDFFIDYKEEINKLGTPRRIKRFCNKARYQVAHLTETENEAFSEKELITYLELLLLMEVYGPKSLPKEYDAFVTRVKKIFDLVNHRDSFPKAYAAFEKENREKSIFQAFYNENRGGLA